MIKQNYDNSWFFEVGYINGEITGKGKEYYKGKVLFEGEYLKGDMHGKEKDYYDNGQISLKGEI